MHLIYISTVILSNFVISNGWEWEKMIQDIWGYKILNIAFISAIKLSYLQLDKNRENIQGIWEFQTLNFAFKSASNLVIFNSIRMKKKNQDTVNQLLFATNLFCDLMETNWFAKTNFREFLLPYSHGCFTARNNRDKEAKSFRSRKKVGLQ